MLKRSPMSRRTVDTGPDKKTRKAVAERSGGYCEMRLPGCSGKAVEIAHRVKRGQGGRHGAARVENNALPNLLHACHGCHAWTHAHPTDAGQLGLMLQEHQDPSVESVCYRGREWLWLTTDGYLSDDAPTPVGVA